MEVPTRILFEERYLCSMRPKALVIEFSDLPPKEWSRNSRVHWSALHRAQQQVNDEVIALLIEQGWCEGGLPEPLQTAQVTITFYVPDKRNRDADNLITRCKPILDALVTAGVIEDDSIAVIGVPEYRVEYRKNQPGTRIEVRDGKV